MVVVVIQFLIYPLFVEKNVHFLPWMNPRAEINPASMSVVGPQGEICRAFGNVFHRWYAAYRTRTEHQARSRWYTSLIEHHVASYSIGAIYIYFFFFNHRIFEAWKKLKERKIVLMLTNYKRKYREPKYRRSSRKYNWSRRNR